MNESLTRQPPKLETIWSVFMEVEGVVHNGIIVPDDASAFSEGTRVRILPASAEKPQSFGERYAQFKGAAAGLPVDLAEQHDHYRLGTPKR